MSTPDRHEHALKLKDEVSWLIDGLSSFAAIDPGEAISGKAAAWAGVLDYLKHDLDEIIEDASGSNPENTRWDYEDVVAVIAKVLKEAGQGSDEGAEYMAKEILRNWREEAG